MRWSSPLLEPAQLQDLAEVISRSTVRSRGLAEELVRRGHFPGKIYTLEGRAAPSCSWGLMCCWSRWARADGAGLQGPAPAMERLVALKVIHQRAAWTTRAVQRFRREVKAAARLSHPNIVTPTTPTRSTAPTSSSWSTSRASTWPSWSAEAGRCRWRRPATTCARRPGPAARPRAGHGPSRHQAAEPDAGQQGPVVKVLDFGLARLSTRPTALRNPQRPIMRRAR